MEEGWHRRELETEEGRSDKPGSYSCVTGGLLRKQMTIRVRSL